MKKWLISLAVFLSTTAFIVNPTAKQNSLRDNNISVQMQEYQYIEQEIKKVSIIENAGNFNDYTDYDDDDWGSSSSGSRSRSSNSGSGDLGFILWIFHIIPFPFNVILILAIVFIGLRFKNKVSSSKQGGSQPYGNGARGGSTAGVKYVSPPSIQVPDNTSMITRKMKEIDQNFDPTKFLAFAEEAYLNIQDAWTNNDWEKIRTIEHEDLFKKHERQLSEYKRNGTRNVLERISVNQTYLYKYVIDNQYEHVSVLIDATMNDYIINETTKQIIRGDYNTRWRGRYILTFTRSVGTLTGELKDEFETTNCPNCGAPIEITSAGECEYCGFLITSSKHDWVVSDFDCIKPDYNVDRRGVIILRQEKKVEDKKVDNQQQNSMEDLEKAVRNVLGIPNPTPKENQSDTPTNQSDTNSNDPENR